MWQITMWIVTSYGTSKCFAYERSEESANKIAKELVEKGIAKFALVCRMY